MAYCSGGVHKYLEVCRLRKLLIAGEEQRLKLFFFFFSKKKVFDEGILCLQDSHVHDVCFMQRLVFDLWVDDGRVGDPCGMGTWGARHHVV